jgi:hypothetical protein
MAACKLILANLILQHRISCGLSSLIRQRRFGSWFHIHGAIAQGGLQQRLCVFLLNIGFGYIIR